MRKSVVLTAIVLLVAVYASAQVQVFWHDGELSRISKANVDGTGVTTVLTGANAINSLEIDSRNGHLYYGNWFAGAIYRCDLDGSNNAVFISHGVNPVGIAVDDVNGYIYWADYFQDRIYRADLDGTNITTLINGLNGPSGIDVDIEGGKLYWTEIDDGTVNRANVDGTGVETLVTGLLSPFDLVLNIDDNEMAWLEWGTITPVMAKANLDGSSVTTLTTTLGFGLDQMTIDPFANRIYFSHWPQGIRRINTDGSGLATAVSAAATPGGVDLYFPPVEISGNCVLSGVTLTYDENGTQTATTNGSGDYNFIVPYGWSGSVTPSLTGYNFSPTSRSYTVITTDQVNQDYTPVLQTFTVSGTITDTNSNALGGISVGFSHDSSTVSTNASGFYTKTVNYGTTTTVTPTDADYTFAPLSASFTNITANRVQDFVGSADPGSIQVFIVGTSDGRWRQEKTLDWRNSGFVLSGLAPGTYVIEFKPVTGYRTPANARLTV